MALLIRPAIASDEPHIAALLTTSWRATYRGIAPPGLIESAGFAERIAAWDGRMGRPEPGRVVLVAQHGHERVGVLVVIPDPVKPGWDRIDNLHVAPDRLGQGIGARLMREASDRLAAIGRVAVRLTVMAGNDAAYRFYERLGGVMGPRTTDRFLGFEVPVHEAHWDDFRDAGTRARAARIDRMAPPAFLSSADLPAVTGSDQPVAAAAKAAARSKQRLGDPFGLIDYGVNRVVLAPGVSSTVPHAHSREDEWVMVLSGTLTLTLDGVEHRLGPGDCAGFPAGSGLMHILDNRTADEAVYLEIGSRKGAEDRVDYAGEDLQIALRPDGTRGYLHRDGTPHEAER